MCLFCVVFWFKSSMVVSDVLEVQQTISHQIETMKCAFISFLRFQRYIICHGLDAFLEMVKIRKFYGQTFADIQLTPVVASV